MTKLEILSSLKMNICYKHLKQGELYFSSLEEFVSQNHNELSLHTSYNGYFQKDKRYALVRMWRKGNACAILVGK